MLVKLMLLLLLFLLYLYEVFSRDFTSAILLFQNNETAAMIVLQTSPVKPFSCTKIFFCSNKFACMPATLIKCLCRQLFSSRCRLLLKLISTVTPVFFNDMRGFFTIRSVLELKQTRNIAMEMPF